MEDQMDLFSWRPRQKVIGFPNELANDDPGSFHQSEWLKMTYDPLCAGLYCQKRPEDWLVQILNNEERTADRQIVERRQFKFKHECLRIAAQSQLQIEMSMRRKPHWFGSNMIRWSENEFDEACLRLANLFWWRDRPSITIEERAREDEFAAQELVMHQWD